MMAQLAVLWEAGSLEEADATKVTESDLLPGDPYIIEIDLSVPVAWAFDLAGAELAFSPFTPDGLQLVDVRGQGASRGIVEYVVTQQAESSQGHAQASIFGLVALVAGFIARHWLAITIAGFTLTAIVSSIRGISILRPITEPIKQDILKPLLFLGGLYVAGRALAKR